MSNLQPCELCGRAVARRTRHHLIPKTRHKNRKNKRDFDREEVRTRILMVCRPCHGTIHATLTEKQLEYDYNTRETLVAHPEIAKFIAWVARRPDDGRRIRVRQNRREKPDRRTLREMKEGNR